MPEDLRLTGSCAAAGVPIPPEVLRQAAVWFVRLRGGEADERALRRWRAWRAAAPEHERAWQRTEALAGRFAGLEANPGAALRALDAARAPVSSARRRATHRLVLLLAGAGAGWGAVQVAPWSRWTADYATATGERRSFTLADGSRVTLNTASALDVRFDAALRLLRLRAGEVLIETAHDAAARPFIVETAEGAAQALGTRFCVRRDEAASRVAVYAGRVELRPLDGAARILEAGEAASFAADAVGMPWPADENAALWTRGLLVADDMPLAELAAELGRYRPGRIACAPAVAQWRISGVFTLDDTDRALAAVARALPVQVKTITSYWVRIDAA